MTGQTKHLKRPFIFKLRAREFGDPIEVMIGRLDGTGEQVSIDHRNPNSPPLVLVLGDTGSGKTVLAKIIATQFSEVGVAGSYIDSKTKSPVSFGDKLNADWRVNRLEESELQTEEPPLLEVVRSEFNRLVEVGGGVLLIDESHELLGMSEGVELLRQITRTARNFGIMVVVLSQRASDFVGFLSHAHAFPSVVVALRTRGELSELSELLGECSDEDTRFLQSEWDFIAGSKGLIRDISGSVSRVVFGPLTDEFLSS